MIGSKTIFGFQVIYWHDMKYGIESESLAVNSFLSNTGNKVITSRLWVNKKYMHPAPSPDGLMYNNQNNLHGIVEIKCLKIWAKRNNLAVIGTK